MFDDCDGLSKWAVAKEVSCNNKPTNDRSLSSLVSEDFTPWSPELNAPYILRSMMWCTNLLHTYAQNAIAPPDAASGVEDETIAR